MKFRYTILYVKDVSASLDFYCDAFGMKLKMLHESGGYGELDTGGTILSFAALSGLKEKNAMAPNAENPTFEIAFETDDVAAGMNKALKAGAKLVQAPALMPWGQTVAFVSDPDGFLVEICTPIG